MGQAQIVRFTTTLESTDCCVCGVTFALPAEMLRMAREKGKFEQMFYCPNGHKQGYGEDTLDKVRKQLAQKEAEVATAKREIELQRTLKEDARREAETERKRLARLKKRVGAGVCPCCKRTFKQLAAHMLTKHPEQVAVKLQAHTADQ